MLAFATVGTAEDPGSRPRAGTELWIVNVTTGDARHVDGSGCHATGVVAGREADCVLGLRAAVEEPRDLDRASEAAEHPKRITDHPAIDWNPEWAPDGRHLYFGSDRGGSLGLWQDCDGSADW